MHFHWDSFDSLISKAFRSIAPPLVNLMMISYIFYEGLGHLIAKIVSWLPAMADQNIVNIQNFSKFPELLENLLPKVTERFLQDFTIEGAKDGATGIALFFQAFFGSALTAMVGLVVGVLAVAYLLDFAVRAIGVLIPIRADLDERRLVYHQSLDGIFKEAGLISTPDRHVSRYFGWLSARMHADALSKESSYFDVRSRLLAAASMNERVFSYFIPYLIFSIISMIWVGGGGFLLFILVLFVGAVLFARQFSLGCEIITNDLETFVAMPLTKEIRANLDERLPTYKEEPKRPVNWMATFVVFPPWMGRFFLMFKRAWQK